MSFINDALKRARRQAREQEATGSGVGYRAVPAHSRQSGWRWLPFVVGGVVVAAAFLVYSALRPGEETASPQPSAASVGAVPATETDAAGTVVVATPVAPAAATAARLAPVERTPSEPLPSSGVSAETRQDQPEGGSSGPADSVEVPDAQASSVEREPPPEVQEPTRLEPGRTYPRRVTAADGSEVLLGGIAYSDTRPIAVVNDSVVSPGDIVAGFTVVDVTPEHVELEADGVRILLTLR